jgi:hypothetical protein
MKATFAGTRRRRAELEDAAITETAQGADHNGRELPVAFPELVRAPIHRADDLLRGAITSSGLPATHRGRSYLRRTATVGFVAVVGLVMFLLVFTIRSRLVRPAAPVSSGSKSSFNESAAGGPSGRTVPAINMVRTRADGEDERLVQPVGTTPEQQRPPSSVARDSVARTEPARESLPQSTHDAATGVTADDGRRDHRGEPSRSRRVRKLQVSADEPLVTTVERAELPVDGETTPDVAPAGEAQSETTEQEGNPYVYK